ncbi:MAG: ROK family protein [Rhodococcus sp.]|nr:ROK family protein [Rhodococcus sp. (in: high G+C Gram-positive bacteria)]
MHSGGLEYDGARPTVTIGIDVGGTNIRAAVVDGEGVIVDAASAPTPRSAESLAAAIVGVVHELAGPESVREDGTVDSLAGNYSIGAVGLAVAGFVNRERTIVRYAPHLPWLDAPVARDLSAVLGLPVVLEHDANAAAVAEYRYGAAAGGRNVVVIALGTGIGGAFVQEGNLYRGSFGVAPELGHIQVVPEGRSCACGKRGCWERYCSGTALVDTAIEHLAKSPRQFTTLSREVATDPAGLTGRRVAGAAQAGDALALAVMADFSQWLGVGISLVADVFDPDLIVISGGVAQSAPLFLDAAREHYQRLATGAGYRSMPRIRSTQLGESAGLIGAAELARISLSST